MSNSSDEKVKERRKRLSLLGKKLTKVKRLEKDVCDIPFQQILNKLETCIDISNIKHDKMFVQLKDLVSALGGNQSHINAFKSDSKLDLLEHKKFESELHHRALAIRWCHIHKALKFLFKKGLRKAKRAYLAIFGTAEKPKSLILTGHNALFNKKRAEEHDKEATEAHVTKETQGKEQPEVHVPQEDTQSEEQADEQTDEKADEQTDEKADEQADEQEEDEENEEYESQDEDGDDEEYVQDEEEYVQDEEDEEYLSDASNSSVSSQSREKESSSTSHSTKVAAKSNAKSDANIDVIDISVFDEIHLSAAQSSSTPNSNSHSSTSPSTVPRSSTAQSSVSPNPTPRPSATPSSTPYPSTTRSSVAQSSKPLSVNVAATSQTRSSTIYDDNMGPTKSTTVSSSFSSSSSSSASASASSNDETAHENHVNARNTGEKTTTSREITTRSVHSVSATRDKPDTLHITSPNPRGTGTNTVDQKTIPTLPNVTTESSRANASQVTESKNRQNKRPRNQSTGLYLLHTYTSDREAKNVREADMKMSTSQHPSPLSIVDCDGIPTVQVDAELAYCKTCDSVFSPVLTCWKHSGHRFIRLYEYLTSAPIYCATCKKHVDTGDFFDHSTHVFPRFVLNKQLENPLKKRKVDTDSVEF
jgi:hypothetical protein